VGSVFGPPPDGSCVISPRPQICLSCSRVDPLHDPLLAHEYQYNTDDGEWNSHRPGANFQRQIEPLLLKYKVDLMVTGHQHMFERVYPVHSVGDKGIVDKAAISADGHVYTRPNATAHVVQATAGVFTDHSFIDPQPDWSAVRGSEWGYGRMTVHNATHLQYEFRDWESEKTIDYFWIIK
jgi:Iron/zinc purple acid phosphatase-like protein C